MATDIKKFLDQEGVSILWGKVAAKVDASVKAEADRALAAEKVNADAIKALDTKVGALPEGSANVIAYVNKKTEGIATDAALSDLQESVRLLGVDVDAIEADYLTSVDYAALEDLVTTEASRADKAEKANAAAIKAVSDDYLKGADKTELSGAISTVGGKVDGVIADYLKAADKEELSGAIALKAAQSDLEAEVTARTNAVSGLQTQINTIMNNPDAEGAINSINEFTTWVEEHGTIADGMKTDINKNKDDIAAMDTAYKAADTAIKGRLDVLEAIDHEAYKAADTALEGRVDGKLANKADTSYVNTELAKKATNDELAGVKATAEAAATKTYVDTELAKKATIEALNGVSAVANAAATKTYVDTELGKKANQSDLEAEVTARQNAVQANTDAITAIKDHATVDSFADVMAEIAKKQDTIPANTYDRHGAAAQALVDAKAYSDANYALIQSLSKVDIEDAIAQAEAAV